MIPMELPPSNPGFQRLVAIVTRDGVLDPNAFPVQCIQRETYQFEPGCEWPAPPKRTFWRRAGDWAKGWGNWALEVFSDGD